MLLKTINTPADLKGLSLSQLQGLCEELRLFLQEQTNTKEGHIRSSLGVTELSVALHYVYDTPYDILIWDVGHQAYIHKILTGRKDQFHTNRQKGGLAGFTSASESIYDPFGAGHASTSISASVGFATAQRLRGQERSVVAVIGDGALTGGMAFEALNYLGEQQLDVLVILNDNESSIDQNIGALARYTNYKELCDTFNINFRGDINGHDAAGLATRLAALKRKRPGSAAGENPKGQGKAEAGC
ncbi:MAG: 1-deoxy-D-xylulose-5-phosphate synthase N-terminal domain-containing protein [Owenweeksia sp.]|nr:1-deoxy-D-xylulose-5-phosphate synthase N-terminal domain-containing protein [Owenweeksia sp.]